MRLDIAAGTAVRFEPGQTREVTLVPLARQTHRLRLPPRSDGKALGHAGENHTLRLCRHVRADHRRPRAPRRHRPHHRGREGPHHLRRGGEVRRRQGDPRRHGPVAGSQPARRRRHGHHQRADRRPLGHRQGRHRHQGRPHRRDRQGGQSRHPARGRPSSSDRAPRSSPAKERSSPPAASTRISISSARSRSRRR